MAFLCRILTYLTDADAVIKCFATAISTAALLYVSPVFFGAYMSPLVIPGTIVVFLATWLYLDANPPKDRSAPTPTPTTTQSGPSRFRTIKFGSFLTITLIIIGAITLHDTTLDEQEPKKPHGTTPVPSNDTSLVYSPFNNTFAFVRWNSAYRNRIPNITPYAPFFHTLHLSIPDHDNEYMNITDDSWTESDQVYQSVAKSMQLILDESEREKLLLESGNASSLQFAEGQRPASEISGVMFFHFDAWIDPLGFADDNFEKIWFPAAFAQDPKFTCLNDTKNNGWMWFGMGYHENAIQSLKQLSYDDRFVLPPYNRFCMG